VGRKPQSNLMSRRTERSYKADGTDELAPHSGVRCSVPEVNGPVVQGEFTSLLREICAPGTATAPGAADREVHREGTEVSRGHSSSEPSEPRPELVSRGSTPSSLEDALKPDGRADSGMADGKHGTPSDDLWEQILSRENLLKAWKRVKANGGAPGIDGMTIAAFPAFARQHWERLRSDLKGGTYRPAAVRRVMIPKPNGDLRPLGLAPALPRLRGFAPALRASLSPLPAVRVRRSGGQPPEESGRALATLHLSGLRDPAGQGGVDGQGVWAVQGTDQGDHQPELGRFDAPAAGGIAALRGGLAELLRYQPHLPAGAGAGPMAATTGAVVLLETVALAAHAAAEPHRAGHWSGGGEEGQSLSALQYWWMSGNGIVQRALNNAWLQEQGVPDLKSRWIEMHYGNRNPNWDPASVNLTGTA